jgi:hypothetical protein
MSVPVVPVRMPMFIYMLTLEFGFMFMFTRVVFMPMPMPMPMPMIVSTVIVSFHPAHLTLVAPATTYSSPAAEVVAPLHNTAKLEQNGSEMAI